MAADRWGIDDHYLDYKGEKHRISAETRRAVLSVMGIAPYGEESAVDERAFSDVLVLRGAQRRTVKTAGELRREDGSVERVSPHARMEIPLGYHQFLADG